MANSQQIRMRILLEGRLQGSNFRLHTEQEARKLGVDGFVRTLSDGRIEIDVQGEREKVEKLLEWCQQEPYGSQIRTLMYRIDEPTLRGSGFTVR